MQRQGHAAEKGEEGAQEQRHGRQEAADDAQEDERAAHPGHRGGQHVQVGWERHSLLCPER